MYYDLILAGFGGQGILLIGDILAYAAMLDKKEVTWMPAYGVEMRGGTANCTVVISSEKIGSPLTHEPCGVISMSKPSLVKFQEKIKKNGLLVVNSSLVDPALITRNDITSAFLPATDLAYEEVGEHKMANMVVLGAFLALSKVVPLDKVEEALAEIFQGEKAKHVPAMTRALRRGVDYERGNTCA